MGAREGAILVCVLLGLPLLLQFELGVEAGRPVIVCVATEREVKSAHSELPPCDYKYHNIGVDCSGWSPNITSVYVGQAEIAPPAPSGGAAMPDPDLSRAHHAHPPPAVTELFPCTSGRQVPGIDCWPPIAQPPALCIEGIDCFDAPASALYHVNHAETTSTAYSSSGSAGEHLSHSQATLPPCDFAGAIPVWNCNNAPQGTLAPALPPSRPVASSTAGQASTGCRETGTRLPASRSRAALRLLTNGCRHPTHRALSEGKWPVLPSCSCCRPLIPATH